MQWEVSVFTSHRIPGQCYRMGWEKPSVCPARCKPKPLGGLGVVTLLWPPCPVLCAPGDLPRGSSSMGRTLQGRAQCVPTAAPKIGCFISMSRGRGQGGKEVTFVIVLFSWWTKESAHLGVRKYMAKSLLILSWFERCKISSVEKHWDLHLETNKRKTNQICTKLLKSNSTTQKPWVL